MKCIFQTLFLLEQVHETESSLDKFNRLLLLYFLQEIFFLTDCIRRATISLSGDDIYEAMKYEGGVHRVQRVPKTESGGRIHTSTITISILPQPEEVLYM